MILSSQGHFENRPFNPTGFDSGNMNAGAKLTYTFTVSGTYTYYCQYHSWMQGTVILVAS